MKHNVTYQELNDEQLEQVVGGTYRPGSSSFKTNLNINNQEAVAVSAGNLNFSKGGFNR